MPFCVSPISRSFPTTPAIWIFATFARGDALNDYTDQVRPVQKWKRYAGEEGATGAGAGEG